jgi:hypothetical protein
MFKNAVNTLARAKLIYNKKLEVYKMIVAFNVHEQVNDSGDTVYNFPVQKKCDFVSGDIPYETLQQDKERIIALVQKQLRTNNIEFV